MKRYEELSEELKDKARVWQVRNYEKWTYMVRDNEIIYCRW